MHGMRKPFDTSFEARQFQLSLEHINPGPYGPEAWIFPRQRGSNDQRIERLRAARPRNTLPETYCQQIDANRPKGIRGLRVNDPWQARKNEAARRLRFCPVRFLELSLRPFAAFAGIVAVFGIFENRDEKNSDSFFAWLGAMRTMPPAAPPKMAVWPCFRL